MNLKKILEKNLREFIEKNFKCWGVEIETCLPPEFLIREHAEQRICERIKCSPAKMKKITIKAWNSKLKLPHLFEYEKQKIGYANSIYRYHNGFIFVFSTKYNIKLGFSQKILVTVYDPKK